MSRSVNRIVLVGNAGSDPDVRRTATDAAVAHLSLATHRRIGKDEPFQERTDWHRLTFWGKAAEAIELYARKGTRLYIEGRIEYGSYEREGVSIPTADIIVNDFLFLDSRYGTDTEVGQTGDGTPVHEAEVSGVA